MMMDEEEEQTSSILSNEASASPFRGGLISPNSSIDTTENQTSSEFKNNGLRALCVAIDISSHANDHMKRPLFVSPLHVFPDGDPATRQVARTMDYPASEASFSFSKGFVFEEPALPPPRPVDEYSLSSLSPCTDDDDDESDECFKHPYSHEEFSPISEEDDNEGPAHDSAIAIDNNPISLKTFPQILETVAKKDPLYTATHGKQVIEIDDDDDKEYGCQGSKDSSDSDFIQSPRKQARKHNTNKKTASARRQQQKKSYSSKYTRHATLPRSKNGCWTCRCRRKKCDETKPSCRTCINLGVPCAGYSEERPEFMVDPKASLEYRSEISRIIREQKNKANDKRVN
ncbi:hypothetical protein TRICI_000266 [Trichomonascus ciferrii]|uniref:Zn(2)-C6 fungal-type domain-containing protein n=1 Tax=Trichomonascus ciferrii TaxID=44093 RepID=A0A642VDX2_9ASCO|nr:hypothetical protein TRICI_000266 [Trichomonascus ciferrii]